MRTQTNSHWVFVLIMFIFFIPFSEINAQEQKEENPKVEIKVNKHKDENGNIIRYDSSYSYSWKGENVDTAFIDSVFKSFKMNKGFGKFFEDDFFGDDFFNQDFFEGFNFDEFFSRDHPGSSADSLKPGIYEHFHSKPFEEFSDFESLQELMRARQKKMMEQFKRYRDSRDSSLKINPQIRKQKNTLPKSKGRTIKT